MAVCISVITSLALFIGFAPSQAYATTTAQLETASVAQDVRYIAILGADTWENANGTHHNPASDLMAVARVDSSSGKVSILTVPRDTKYNGITDIYPKAKSYKSNMAFRYIFMSKIKSDWSNYDEAIDAAAKAACKVLGDTIGVTVDDYALVDLYTFQDIVDKMNGVTVDIPVAIGDYVLYSNGQTYSINGGKTGPFLLNGWDASVVARNRQSYFRKDKTKYPYPYYSICYKKLSDYKGDSANLLIRKIDANGKVQNWYVFDGDGTRQYVNRRMFAALIDKALTINESAWSFFWNELVQNKLVWTNLSLEDVQSIGNGLAKAKKAGNLTVYGASIVSPAKGRTYYFNNVEQYLIDLDADDITRKNAIVSEFRAGKPMTSGWACETILGKKEEAQPKNTADDYITYRISGATTAAVASVQDKASVTIPKTTVINGKTYNVTAIDKNAFSPVKSKVTTVSIGANVTTIGEGAFTNCTKLKKVTGGVSVKAIGANAFRKCTALTTCSPAASKKLTSVGTFAFEGDKALTSMSLGSDVASIGAHAFANCAKLKKVTGAASVKSIGTFAFSGCKALTTCKPASSKKLKTLSKGLFEKCSSLTSFAVSSSVTTIGEKAFANCTKLKKITGGAAVKTIGNYAFTGSKKLSKCSPVSSKKLKKIGSQVFKKTAMKKLTIKSTLLTKKGVKNSLKYSSVKTIKVSVAKSKKSKTIKKYKKYFAKKNSGAKYAVTLS